MFTTSGQRGSFCTMWESKFTPGQATKTDLSINFLHSLYNHSFRNERMTLNHYWLLTWITFTLIIEKQAYLIVPTFWASNQSCYNSSIGLQLLSPIIIQKLNSDSQMELIPPSSWYYKTRSTTNKPKWVFHETPSLNTVHVSPFCCFYIAAWMAWRANRALKVPGG